METAQAEAQARRQTPPRQTLMQLRRRFQVRRVRAMEMENLAMNW